MRRNHAIYLTLLSTCFSVGFLTLLFGYLIPPLKHIDSVFFKHSIPKEATADSLLSKYDGTARERSFLIENHTISNDVPVSLINLDLTAPEKAFNNPPTASDIAVICDKIRSLGVENIHLTTQFHQDSTDPQMNHIIQSVLSNENTPTIKNFSIPLELTRAAKPSDFPSFLKNCQIPISQVEGDLNLIPSVNKIVHSPIDKVNFSSPSEIPSSVYFGFSNLESEDTNLDKIHLIAQWEGRILFHHSLLTSILMHNVKMEDISITLGTMINLGEGKPIIPIDSFGCIAVATIPDAENLQPIIDSSEIVLGTAKNIKPHVLVTATATENTNYQLIQNPLPLVESLYTVPMFQVSASYYRLPMWLEACILIEFTLIAACLYHMRGFNLHLSYSLLLISVWPLSQMLTHLSGYWFPTTPLILLILTAWIFTTILSGKWRLRRKTHKLNSDALQEVVTITE